MTESLRIDGLSRTHPGALAPAVSGLDLNIAAGHSVALLGPSGSGKTTVLRLIAGLDSPDLGDIHIGDFSVLGLAPERRGIAMVSQRPLLFPHLNVTDNVAFAPRMAGATKRSARATAERFLELVQLSGLGRRRPCSLSGGQQQRVALARALAATPDILLLDEPFSALDPALKADMHQLLVELRAVLQPTIVMVTHDHHEASLLADSIAIIIEGTLHQHATAHELYARPLSLTVSRFMGCLNEVQGSMIEGRFHCQLGALEVADEFGDLHGPATMVIRQEAAHIVEASDPAATATGRVERLIPQGARTLVEVRTPSVSLFAETTTQQLLRTGETIGIVLPPHHRSIVVDAAGADTSSWSSSGIEVRAF